MITYQIFLADATGKRVALINEFYQLEYTIRLDGGIGTMAIVVPKYLKNLFNESNKDYRIQIWRSVNRLPFVLDGRTEFLCMSFETDDNTVRITGESVQSLLKRRIVAYPANIANYSIFTGYTGDIMKTIVRTNFGSDINASIRDGNEIGADISSYMSVASNAGDGITNSIACSRRNVYDVVMDLAQSSWESGIYCVGLVTSNGSTLLFDTYTNQVGSFKQIVLSPDIGTIQNPQIGMNLIDEKTFVVAAGAGAESARVIATAFNQTRLQTSVLNRVESFYENTQVKSVGYLNYLAQSNVKASRGIRSLSANVVQTNQVIRGIQYNLGDYLPIYFDNAYYVMRLDIVEVSISGGQYSERIQLRI